MDDSCIEAGLVVGYGKTRVATLSQNIPLDQGAFSILVGSNGSGKTTFLKTLCDAIPPVAGTAPTCQKVYLPEELDFPPALDARTLLFTLFPKAHLYVETAMLFGVPMATPYQNLSKGNRQKLRVICAEGFAHLLDAKILCLDEPLSGLDTLSRHLFIDIWSGRRVAPRVFSNAHRIVSLHSGEAPPSIQTIAVAGGKIHRLPPLENCDQWMAFAANLGVNFEA